MEFPGFEGLSKSTWPASNVELLRRFGANGQVFHPVTREYEMGFRWRRVLRAKKSSHDAQKRRERPGEALRLTTLQGIAH
jgi:hypothetical protein